MSTRSVTEQFRPDLALGLAEYDFEADQNDFIGLRIAPVYDVADQSAPYPIDPIESQLIDIDDERSAQGDYANIQGKRKWDNYATVEHGVEEPCDARTKSINKRFWDDELLAAQRTRDVVLRNQERRIVTAALAGAGNNTALNNSYRWSAHSAAAPVDDCLTAKRVVRGACGRWGNVAVMDAETFEDCRACDQVLARAPGGTGGTDPKTISVTMLAAILGFEEIILSNAMRNTKNRGQDGAIFATIWPRDQVLVFYRSKSKDTRRAQYMRTFHWAEDGSKIGGTMESYYDPRRRSAFIRHRMDTHEKVLYGAAGYKITNVVASA